MKYFPDFSQKIGFDISCKLSSKETVCIKRQSLFSRKSKKNINLSSAEFAHRVIKVNSNCSLNLGGNLHEMSKSVCLKK